MPTATATRQMRGCIAMTASSDTASVLAQHLDGVPGSLHGDPGDGDREGLRQGQDEAQELRQAGPRGEERYQRFRD